MTGPSVVVVGAGVVGAAVADELSARGWDDVTVVDQGSLPEPGGSSSHAPGLVFQVHAVQAMSQMAQYTVRKLRGLEHGGQPSFLPVGGLEVATTQERLAELHRRCGWAVSWGLDARVVSPEECVRLHPLLDGDRVLGGLYGPADGVARSVLAVNAQLDRARSRGVRVLERHEVRGVRTRGGRVVAVEMSQGTLPADVVVCCAGIWGQRVAAMVDVVLPLTPLAHQMAWTGRLPGLVVGVQAERPIVRHQQAGLYYRDRDGRLGIGSFAHRPLPVDVADLRGVDEGDAMPSVLPFTEEDFAGAWDETRRLLPATRQARVEDAMNGLFSFTVDDLPIIGPAAGVDGFWAAEAVWVTHSAGVGLAVAQWLVDGSCSAFDLRACELDRFAPHQLTPAFVQERDCRNYVEVYDIKHPLDPAGPPRPVRTSPFLPRQQELGAVLLEQDGWERPQWYESNAPLLEGADVPRLTGWAARHWSPVVVAEARATRASVALYDVTPQTRLEVSGPGALVLLQWLTTADVDRPVGSVTPCLLLAADGRLGADVVVARLGPDVFHVGADGPQDEAWLRRHLPPDGTVVLRDTTPGTCAVGLWGPQAPGLLAALSPALAEESPDGTGDAVLTSVGHVPVLALWVSTVGEPGWELSTTADLGLGLWDVLLAAGRDRGIVAAGRGALSSLRLEQGVRVLGTDVGFDCDPWEAGLDAAVALDGPEFLGRTAAAERRAAVRRTLACLELDEPGQVVLGREPVFDGGACVGHVTSGGLGATTGTSIAYAWLPIGLGRPGQRLEVSWFGQRLPATVVPAARTVPAQQP